MTGSNIQKTRITNKLPVAREGLTFIIPEAIITIILFFQGVPSIAMQVGLITLSCLFLMSM